MVIRRASFSTSSFRGIGGHSRCFLSSTAVNPFLQYFLRLLNTVDGNVIIRQFRHRSFRTLLSLHLHSEGYVHVLSDTPDLSLVTLSRSGFPAHPRLVSPHTDSSSYFFRSYLDKVLTEAL